ncbi:hypothetical protein H257_08545 [Aphanomyces astaci]|uniref:Uncharacterized protein n=1 Tax=Aphanomyces astaci TaxID=112090 RepID=W4GDA9_APHAT|nr:hypothetical protein H257_08545 [Aphanomyces astaci]ETV77645.1 hypothetical protein H257_08545 [Aphanomyces astaci]|eukprot:XP_009832755.1 hypothetical protein H257_08545 [Aphanomyces astaci]
MCDDGSDVREQILARSIGTACQSSLRARSQRDAVCGGTVVGRDRVGGRDVQEAKRIRVPPRASSLGQCCRARRVEVYEVLGPQIIGNVARSTCPRDGSGQGRAGRGKPRDLRCVTRRRRGSARRVRRCSDFCIARRRPAQPVRVDGVGVGSVIGKDSFERRRSATFQVVSARLSQRDGVGGDDIGVAVSARHRDGHAQSSNKVSELHDDW